MSSGFKDHFSGHSASYSQYRPTYPAALFAYLASIAPARNIAWDCATGTGQAAVRLAEYFENVIATDASAQQIENARSHEKIRYTVAHAEDSGIVAKSIDLIVVAQALHWFDLDRFYTEVRRVLVPAGVLAVWSYNLLRVTPQIDDLVNRLYGPVLDQYWPAERKRVEQGYGMIPLPFDEIESPYFSMSTDWDLPQLLGYLGTWSAVQKYRAHTGQDPLDMILTDLKNAWGNAQMTRRISWPLSIRIGRNG